MHRIADEVIDAGTFRFGPQTARLEQQIAAYRDGAAVAITSCTQALTLALRVAGVRPGGEVVVIAVQLHGHMADMPQFLAVSREHGLGAVLHHGQAVVEDCAQAAGAALDGRAAGTWGDFGCFSFRFGKCVGGLADDSAIVTDSAERAARLRRLTDMGRERGQRHVHRDLRGSQGRCCWPRTSTGRSPDRSRSPVRRCRSSDEGNG